MQPVPTDEDDTGGKPVFLIQPSENVYSYFMFIGPTENKRADWKIQQGTPRGEGDGGTPQESGRGINWDIAMGYLLIFMNFFMQAVLLYLIFEEVVVSNVEWQNGIMKLGGKGDHVMGIIAETPGQCNDGQALCFTDVHGDYTCAPPSVQLVGRWEELDTNRDGIWQREEVVAAQKELQCRYVVDPIAVFDVLIAMLKEREKLIWLHPHIREGSAISKTYFTYIMSDVVMCGYRDQDMCANLMERGFFHAPLKYGTSPRVGKTIDSALKYCKDLLAPGGKCERNLPSTYAVWKITSTGECGEPEYETFKYTNPGSGTVKSLLSVDYGARVEYELAQEVMFNMFKGIIIFTWLLAMASEYRDVIKIMTLCVRFPDAADFGDEAVLVEQDPSDPEDIRYKIQGITKQHRYTMMLLCLLRVCTITVLMFVGVSYLIKTNDYADLIMNGVALTFIAEVSSILYDQVLREEVKDQTEDIKAIKVEMYGIDYLNRRPALIDILNVVTIIALVLVILQWQKQNIVVPVFTALECTCINKGDTCFEANRYNYDFWHEYWLNSIPAVLKDIAAMKAKALGGGAAAAAAYLQEFTSASEIRADIATKADNFMEAMKDLRERVDELHEETEEEHAEKPKTRAKHVATRGRRVGDVPLEPRAARATR